ncbi:GIY-YIG nuclease family protein [Candidatus Mycoplasma mahonii]|uniref:GIY-YIG nuclease family protein n=1 Tax=Candidatus Mycoplasma mahonii TaxID=3004105 RepID=UPI0026EEBF05|nr:GIY-YIG nuclease family protein [Candidatus Mycoplasma mahonii]WKX02395.1 GIY-YIG nuclease family protein [Candidatus Mycoplasma mahonii]
MVILILIGVFIIIVGVIGLLIGLLIFNSSYLRPVCYKCKKPVSAIGDIYFKGTGKITSRRSKCLIHQTPGYDVQIDISEKHYIWMNKNVLNDIERKKLESQKKFTKEIKIDNLLTKKCIFNSESKKIEYKINIFKNEKWDSHYQSGIYMMQLKSTKQIYVGQSKNVIKRLKEHFQESSSHFNSKNSKNRSDYIVKTLINCSVEKLNFFEVYFIQKYGSFEIGFNKNRGNINKLTNEEKQTLRLINNT